MPPQVVTVKNSGKVAAALANEKCQRILEYLGKHEDATETSLAKGLNLPLSTIHYNMKTLVDARLVLGDQYTYSSRGKAVTHYRLNRNPIVIVQEENQLALLKAIVPAAVLAAGAAVIYDMTRISGLMTPDNTIAAMEYAPALADESMRTFARESAPMAADAAQLAADNAPMAMKAAPSALSAMQATTPAATQGAALPWFLGGVISVLVLSFVILLALRWWDRRSEP